MEKKFLNEDGSLNIERINKLPIEEFMNVVGGLSKEQYMYFLSKQPINEMRGSTKAIIVDYTMEDDIARGAIDINEYLKIKRKKYGIL